MKKIEIKADFPGCGKSHTLCLAYAKFPSKRKYYIVPQNKQKQDVISLLESMGCNSPKVATIDEFLGNWKCIYIDDEIRFIKTEQVSSRAPTKRQIDLFIDEFSSISNKTLEIITKNFNIRNLIVAGDNHQFDPIPFESGIYQVGSKTKKEYVYKDDGSLPKIQFDKTYVLTKPMRTIDSQLQTLLKAIKNANAEIIWEVIKNRQWKGKKYENDLHIAYTNKVVDEMNEKYASEFNNKQYITINNDKAFNLMKGRILNETEYKKVLENKKKVLQESQIVDVENELKKWAFSMFDYAFAVTSHKLQGATIRNRNIIIHLDDILDIAFAITKDESLTFEEKQIELDKKMDVFHKFLYVAVSRATELNQIYFGASNNILDALEYIDPFIDENDENVIKTAADIFNFDELFSLCDLIDAKNNNLEIAEAAINMTYKQFVAKYNLSIGTWKKLRAAYRLNMGSDYVAYKDAEKDPSFENKGSKLPTVYCLSPMSISENQILIKSNEKELNLYE